VTRRTWLVFCAVQLLGCVFVILARLIGLEGSLRSAAGLLLLLPGILLVTPLALTLFRVTPVGVLLITTVACNAIFWVACSVAWRKLRGAGATRERTWLLAFGAVQLLGLFLVHLRGLLGQPENVLFAFPWLAGIVLLLPSDLLLIALDETLHRTPTESEFVRSLVIVACNAIFWLACFAVWRKLRGKD
jgi:hypothetical protein